MTMTSTPRLARDDARRASRREGERRRDVAWAMLETRREQVILRARRVLLTVLLSRGEGTMDDVRDAVTLPAGVDPVCLGCVPGPLARAGIIRAAGLARTSRPTAHARPLTVWRLVDRDAAERWLTEHPLLPDDTGPVADTTEPALDYTI